MFSENDWDYNVERDTVECPVDCVSRDELNEMKTGITLDLLMYHWSCLVLAGEEEIHVMVELCQKVVDRL